MKFDDFLNIFKTEKRKGSLVLAYRLRVHQQTVEKWRMLGVPTKYWPSIIAASKGKVTKDHLFEITTSALKQRGIM